MNGFGFAQYPQRPSVTPQQIGDMLLKKKQLTEAPQAFQAMPPMGAPLPDPSAIGSSPRPRIV